jgi:DNA (cytosine-5)-methyltransferase 1
MVLCENDPLARGVLHTHFPDAELVSDVRRFGELPECDVITAGFPCQDLSQVGRAKGIGGAESGLITAVFDLIRSSRHQPIWLVLENVPFMLQLDRGRAIREIVSNLEALGWSWAYRVIDTRAFGLPQRRRRVILIASKTRDPRPVLLEQDAGQPNAPTNRNYARGFYWTEGNRGLGWAVDAVPPLKPGSRLGIPAPPAIWFPRRRAILVPTIEGAELLQGFPAGWTLPAAMDGPDARKRWRLVGNAVSVPVAQWIGHRLLEHGRYGGLDTPRLVDGSPWPDAAWGAPGGERRKANVSSWPIRLPYVHLAPFLRDRLAALSPRATRGFLYRVLASTLRVDQKFIFDLKHHLDRYDRDPAQSAARPSRQSAYEGHSGPGQSPRESFTVRVA